MDEHKNDENDRLDEREVVETKTEEKPDKKVHPTNDPTSDKEDLDSEKKRYVKKGKIGTQKSKETLKTLQEQLLKVLKKDIISVLHPDYEGDFELLDEAKIIQIQRESGLNRTHEIKLNKQGKIVFPKEHIVQLIISVHVQNVHGSLADDLFELSKFKVLGMTRDDVEKQLRVYRSLCLMCARKPHIFRRPFDRVIEAKGPREVIALDYLYINNKRAILVVIDVYSRKVLLKPCTKKDARRTVETLLEWDAHFGLKNKSIILTDNGSHFANKVVNQLCTKLRMKKSFSVAHAPWSNGHVESKNSAILKLIRTLTHELMLNQGDWETQLNIIMGILNNRRIASRCNKTPNELFLHISPEEITNPWGLKRTKRKDQIMLLDKLCKRKDFEECVNKLVQEREKIANRVYDHTKWIQQLARKRHNDKLGVGAVQFTIGEWVLMSIKDTPRQTSKTKKIWHGPFKIINVVGNNTYEIKSLTDKVYIVHASRLWFYSTEKFVPDEYVKNLFKITWGHFEVEELSNIRLDDDGEIVVTVKWFGFNEPTDEPIDNVVNGAHLLLKKLIKEDAKKIDPQVKKIVVNKIDKYIRELKICAFVENVEPESDDEQLDKDVKLIKVYTGKPTYDRGWTQHEIKCLIRLMGQHPIGIWDKFCEKLINKSKIQIVSKVQKLLDTDCISTFHGKTIKLDENMDYNVEVECTESRDLVN